MTVYTTAARVAKHNVCEGGVARTAKGLAERGLTMDSRVTMQQILEALGLTDTLYSFVSVEKPCRAEASQVVRDYLMFVTGLACRFLTLTHPEHTDMLMTANKVINKRCKGIDRPELASVSYKSVRAVYLAEQHIDARHWLNVYLHMLTPQANHITAVQATITLLEGCKVAGVYDEVHARLVTALSDLLGVDPTHDDSSHPVGDEP